LILTNASALFSHESNLSTIALFFLTFRKSQATAYSQVLGLCISCITNRVV